MPHLPRRPSPARHARSRWLAVGLLALVTSGGAMAVPASADAAALWAVHPADTSYGAGRQDLSYTVGPGGRIADELELVNPGPDPLRLRLTPADATLASSGQLTSAPGRPRPDGVSGWVHLAHAVVTVPAGRSVAVPFTVTPPRDAAAGDHVGGVVTALDGAGAARPGPGLPVRLRVSGALRPALAVEDLHADYAGVADPLGSGSATVSYAVRNTGNVVLTARQAVSVAGPLGTWRRQAPAVADSPPLPPGATWRVSTPVDDVAPAIRLAATVALTPLQGDAAGSIAPLATSRTSAHALGVPWTLLLALLAIVVVALVALRLLRRSSAPRRARRATA